MIETDEYIQLDFEALERGYKSCRGAVKKFFASHIWTIKNLPGDQRQAMDAVLFNLMRTIDLLDLESGNGLPLDVYHETRDSLSDAFQDKCSSVELAALVDTSVKYDIPKQFLFDPLRGADYWIRNREFNTYDELEAFCSHVGGSSMAAATPILGVVKEGWEVLATQCGKAIMLNQILASSGEALKRNKIFFAKEDMEDCGVDIAKLKLKKDTKPFRFLVRLYATRIEKLFYDCAEFANHLDFDGNRSLKSLLGMHWKMLLKMKVEPECILSEEGVLSRRDQLTLKSRALLGMEKELPIIAPSHDDHHH